MNLPVPLDLAPMEARLVAEIPTGEGWQFEPKWDGFRCIAYRDDATVMLRSKSGQPLERYFPEIVAGLLALPALRFVLDGELVVPQDGALSFERLLQRIHPAASRVHKLAVETPATLLVFDLLAEDQTSYLALPLRDRRLRLIAFARRYFTAANLLMRLSPATQERRVVDDWYARVGGALDGVVAKRVDAPYRAGERDAVVKIKAIRTADCIIGGYRLSERGGLGSLLLGLYDRTGRLDYVGFSSGFGAAAKAALLEQLAALHADESFDGRAPGGPSRWNRGKSSTWQPVRPQLVLEVGFDQVASLRFRHGTRPLRWRPDKAPASCTLAQIENSDRTLALFE